LGFFELLLLFAFVLFVIIEFLLILTKPTTSISTELKHKSKLLFLGYCTLSLSFILLSVYYMLQGTREFLWFILFAIVAGSSLYFANSSRTWQRQISVFVVLSMIVVQSTIPIIQNRGVIFGPDQWRDLEVTTFIKDEGSFKSAPYISGSYYSVIPLFNVLNAMLSQLSGWDEIVTFSLFPAILALLGALSIYAIITRLTKSSVLALLVLIVSASMPRHSSGQYIPSELSGSLGMLLVLFLVMTQIRGERKLYLVASLFALVVSITHPLGMLTFFALSLGILIVNKLSSTEKLLAHQVSRIRGVFSICLLISIGYWSSQQILFNGVFGQVARLLETLVSFRQVPSVYQPQYQVHGFEMYSLSWALPVATVAAYLLFSLPRLVSKAKTKVNRDFSYIFFYAAGLMGIVMVLGAFASVISNPGASVERYINGPAYTLLALTTSYGIFLLLRTKRISAFVSILLLATVIIGTSSPDNAPFEHPTFGAFRSTWLSTIEARSIVSFLSNNTRVFSDHDIPVVGVARLEGLTIFRGETYISYQRIRNVLEIFKNNSCEPFDTEYVGAVLVIKTSEIKDPGLFSNYINILYDSKRHIVVMVPHAS